MRIGTTAPDQQVPPNDPETEQAVLGAMMQDAFAFQIAQAELMPHHFHDGNHRKLFEVLNVGPDGCLIDLMIVKNYLKKKGISICGAGNEGSNGDVLARMCEIGSPANIETYIKILQSLYRERRSLEIGQVLQSSNSTNPDQRIEQAKEELEKLVPKKRDRDYSNELAKEIDEEIDGIRSGLEIPFFHHLTKTNCFLPGAITTLCGSPGASKSLWAMEAVWQLIWAGHAACMLAMESGWKLHARRALSQIISNSRLCDWRFAREKPDEMRGLLESVSEHKKVLIEKRAIQCPEESDMIDAKFLLRWINEMGKAGMRFLVIDPITKLRSSGRDKWAEQEKFMGEVGGVVQRWGISLLIVTHPKTADRKGNIAISLDNMAGLPDFRQFTDSAFWLDSHQSVVKSFNQGLGCEELAFNRTMHCKKARLGPMIPRVGYEMSGFTLRHVERGYIQ